MVINGFTAGFAEGVDHVQYAAADACSEVVDVHTLFARQFFHRDDVAVGEIHHVDVVANAGAIFSWVVVAKYGKGLAAAHGNLCDVRHQVVGNTLRIFPYRPTDEHQPG